MKFADGVASGMTTTDAYVAAYPKCTRAAARGSAHKLMRRPDVQAEIQRIRQRAQELGGGSVMTLLEKRRFLARVVRAQVERLADAGADGIDSDLWESVKITSSSREFKLPSKLAAIRADHDLAGNPASTDTDDALADLLRRL